MSGVRDAIRMQCATGGGGETPTGRAHQLPVDSRYDAIRMQCAAQSTDNRPTFRRNHPMLEHPGKEAVGVAGATKASTETLGRG